MIKGFRQIAGLTTLSRVFGLVRDMSFSHFLGAGWLMTAWTMGFKIPNLARRLFGEGAASASFIPVYSEQLHKNPEQARQLVNTVVTVLFVLLAAIVLIGELLVWYFYGFETRFGAKLGLALCSIMLPYMIFVCIVAIMAGVLNVHKHFAAPAAAPIILNIFIISSLLVTGWVLKIKPEQQVFVVATAVLFAGLAQIALQIRPLRQSGISLRPAWEVHSEAFKKILIMMGPMVIGLTVTQINTLADDLIALALSNEQGYPLDWGAVSYLYYAQRLYQFPLGVLGISLATAIFPVMSANAARGDFDSLRKTILRGIKGAVFVAIPATAGLVLVARPLVSAVFEHGKFTSQNTQTTAWTLTFYALGLCGFFCQQILTRSFYSMQNSKVPMRSAIVAVFVNVILNLTLVWFMGTGGLALSTAICSYLQVAILLSILYKRFGHSLLDGAAITLAKTLAATAIMLVVGKLALQLCSGFPDGRRFDILRLAITVPLAAGVYFAAAKALRIEMLSLVAGRDRRGRPEAAANGD
ncbi:MAG: murein biosynthesis integral membrane protein MurJ [Planctomycetota bacterium]|jgi:putative peptidoglycan lipid II flippase